MVDPQLELDKLKQSLNFNGYNFREIDNILNDATKEVNSAVATIVADAMLEANRIGSEFGIDDFADQIRIVKAGSTYQVVTDSGKTDFSTPGYPMLPSLLKNAKRAKDGSLYKVIPIKQKALANIFDMQRDVDESRKAMMEAAQTDVQGSVSLNSAFSGLAAAQEYISRRNAVKAKQSQTAGEVKFRVASSKQDPSKIWVQPPRSRNFSALLVDLNRKLEADLDSAITSIVATYETNFIGGR